MKLGMLVNTDRHLDDVKGLVNAALSKGHEVTIFTMGEGTRLLENPEYIGICKLKGVSMAFCDHNATGFGVNKSVITEEVVCGSQYNNSVMMHESDRVIVL